MPASSKDSNFAHDAIATPNDRQYTSDISVHKLSADAQSAVSAQARFRIMQSANFSAVYLAIGKCKDCRSEPRETR